MKFVQLEHILCGSRDIGDLSELRLRTKYRGAYSDEHPVVNWFWVSEIILLLIELCECCLKLLQDVLSAMSTAHKRRFLQFVTGSERIPLGGIANLGYAKQSSHNLIHFIYCSFIPAGSPF